MKAIALKKGSTQAQLSRLQETGMLRCDACGEGFVIGHPRELANPEIAERHWLEAKLAEEHALEKNHANRIELPDEAIFYWRGSGQEKKAALQVYSATLASLLATHCNSRGVL